MSPNISRTNRWRVLPFVGMVTCALLATGSSPAEEGGRASAAAWSARLARRRAVLDVSRAEDSPAAYVEFLSGGYCDPGGQDITVFDEKGNRVPHRIMSIGPGDRLLIAYQLTDSKRYFLYYSQPGASASPPWTPQCGVFLRTYQRPSGTTNTVAELESVVRSVRAMFGSGYRPAIFDGSNPYGPSDDYVSIYTAYIRISKAGTYGFATNSDDSSALYIDGQLVASFPGIHRATATGGQRSGEVSLKEGVHLLTYYHVEYTGPQATTAAWKRPGEKFFTPIPAEAFVAMSPSSVTAIEDQRGRLLDFSFEIDEVYAPENGNPLIGIGFRSFSLNLGEESAFLWDFGDGERSNEKSPTHVYLSEGTFTVSLTARDEENRRHTASHYVNAVHLEDRNSRNPEATREKFEKILLTYTCQKLSPDELETLHDFYAGGEGNESQVAALSSMLLKAVPPSQPERRAKFLLSWADSNRGSNSRDIHLQRVRFYDEAAKITQSKTTRGEALLALGDVYLDYLNDNNAALNCYRTVANENAEKRITRRAVIGQGDVYLFSGDLTTAVRFYDQAGILPEDAKGAEALRTSYGNLIEGYIKQKDFKAALEAIETWEWKYPMVKTRGYPLILRSRIALARGNLPELQKYTGCIIQTLEDDSFKPEAYYLLISSLLRQNQTDLARGHYAALREHFPRDPYVELLRRFFP
jgi:tetratricopeptide (TPR) repeat protein